MMEGSFESRPISQSEAPKPQTIPQPERPKPLSEEEKDDLRELRKAQHNVEGRKLPEDPQSPERIRLRELNTREEAYRLTPLSEKEGAELREMKKDFKDMKKVEGWSLEKMERYNELSARQKNTIPAKPKFRSAFDM